MTMLRLVFEYPSSFTPWNPHQALGDAVLLSLAKHSHKLDTLAITRTSSMTSNGFNTLLKASPLKVLDFHKYFFYLNLELVMYTADQI